MHARAAAPALADDSVFAPAFARLSDAALLAHFRMRERPLLFVVEEPEEITPEKIAGVMDGVFTFNGETHALGRDFDWRANPSADQEWQILLHKFYYSVGLARAFETTGGQVYLDRWRTLTASWMNQRIPADFIAADVTGRRLQNWVYAWSIFVRSPLLPAGFHRELLVSLHRQTEVLLTILHKARNHRTLELYAILLVAIALPGIRPGRPLARIRACGIGGERSGGLPGRWRPLRAIDALSLYRPAKLSERRAFGEAE